VRPSDLSSAVLTVSCSALTACFIASFASLLVAGRPIAHRPALRRLARR
jgi:hypothetical protein